MENQITALRPMRSPMGPPANVPMAKAPEINEEIDLRVLHRNLEMVDQIEGVETAEARGVDEFREHQRQQDQKRQAHRPRPRLWRTAGTGRGGVLWAEMMAVPAPDAAQNADGGKRNHPEPDNTGLPARQNDPGGQQRPERRADIAADLEQALRHAVAPARGDARHARGLRMEDRRANANCSGGN